MDVAVIMGILNLAAKYGIPAVQDMLETWNRDEPLTLEDVQSMEQRFKDPSSYFKKD